jgi:hypothetical protein
MPSNLPDLTRHGILFKVLFGHFARLFSIYERFPGLRGEDGLRARFAQA